MPPTAASADLPVVALFVTCLVNSLRPGVAHACIQILENAGFRVEVPPAQTCCGQPGYNNGQLEAARKVAQLQIQALEPFAWVVVPSGSCAGMISQHYPRLLANDAKWQQRAQSLAAKTLEFSAFLHRHRIGLAPPAASPARPPALDSRPTAHHTSCSCRRETRSHEQADQLLQQKLGEQLRPFAEAEVCCGFGGTFAAKFTAISARLGTTKLDLMQAAGATRITSADLGCLLHLQGLARQQQRPLEFLHLAEILAADIAPGQAPDAARNPPAANPQPSLANPQDRSP